MNFNDFWNRVKDSGDLQLMTKSKKHPFTMHYQSSTDTIEISPQNSRGISTPISRTQFEKAWNDAIRAVAPFEYDNYRKYEHIASYFGPIMEHLLNGANIE